ncbi:MAG: nuclear transport factor 2 family protein [Pyrinomonadaceae bacterium]
MKKLILFFGLFVIFSSAVFSQNIELVLDASVKPHAGVDSVYKAFSESYRTLNVDMVAGLYSKNAAYLVPDEEIMIGRDKIHDNFNGFFESVKKDGRTMTISFRIVQRRIDKELGYDVGVYTLRSFKDGKETGMGQGKFVVVAVKEKDGKWAFQVDGYSGLKPVKTN